MRCVRTLAYTYTYAHATEAGGNMEAAAHIIIRTNVPRRKRTIGGPGQYQPGNGGEYV